MTLEAPPRGRALRAAAWIATAVAAVALAALVLLLVVSGTDGYPVDGPLAWLARGLIVIALVAWLASIAGVVLALVARARSTWHARRMLVAAIALSVPALLGCIAVTLGTLLWLGLTHPFADNPAADAGRRLSAQLRANGGTELCTDGDPGLGPDNTQPWYSAWLEVPDGSSDPAAVGAALQRAGFHPVPGRAATGTQGRATATVDRLGTGDVEIDCASGFEQWGHTHSAPQGYEVVGVQVQLPPRTLD